VGKQKTILVVDDEETIRTIVEQGLSLFGYRVLKASSGEEALRIYRERGKEIDLVFLDLIMPGMSGLRCFEELREMDPEVKVIVMSGYPIEEEVLAKATGSITKPFGVKELLEAIRQARPDLSD